MNVIFQTRKPASINKNAPKWMESSAREIALARAIAQRLYKYSEDTHKQCEMLEAIALRSAVRRIPLHFDSKLQELLITLYKAFPALHHIESAKPFPEGGDDLSSNFFGRLAYEIGALKSDPIDQGIVGTPWILAQDMVAIAAAYWLGPIIEELPVKLLETLLGLSSVTGDKSTTIQHLLAGIQWYDPCVGTGVFPLSIVLLLHRFGVKLNAGALGKIKGADCNPLAVGASEIRLSFLVSSITGKSYSRIRASLRGHLSVEDSLVNYNEQGGLWGGKAGNVDVCVGNPPYVRSHRLSTSYKAWLKKSYPSVASGNADLYNYFIAHGLLSLGPNGRLCYVSPASFQKSKSGEGTRSFINKQGALEALFDFDELPVFAEASVHPSVYVIGTGQSRSGFAAYSFSGLPQQHPLLSGLSRSSSLPSANGSARGWQVSNPEIELILALLSKGTIPLSQTTGEILSGIKTGHKQAYVIKKEHMEKFQEAHTILKPILQPANIRAWRYNWDGTYLLLVKKGQVIPEHSSLMQHFKAYEIALRRRSDVRDHPTWYSLRECSYYDLFSRPKIIFPDIATQCRFAMDLRGYLIPDGAFMIPAEDYFLLGLLNSCIGRLYFRARCNSIGILISPGVSASSEHMSRVFLSHHLPLEDRSQVERLNS
jgi:hypothetical protein